MAIIADKFYNLADYAKQFDPSGQELAIAEVLTQTNEIIADMPFTERTISMSILNPRPCRKICRKIGITASAVIISA